MTEAVVVPVLSIEALRPAGELASALGSFAASAYYVRMIGAAAFRPVRAGEGRVIRSIRVNDGWALTLAVFVAATLLAASLVWAFEQLGGYRVGGHAAFTAVLITTVWPYASDRGARAALALFLVLVIACRLLLQGEMPRDLIAGIVIGIACVCVMRAWLAHRVAGTDSRLPSRS